MMEGKIENRERSITVKAEDLPLHCPMPHMVLWNSHPRVYLPIEETGKARCPYCSTEYTLEGGALPPQH
jgi:uncharacterized Zn-finger protein